MIVSGNYQNNGSKGENYNSTSTREDDKTVSSGVFDKEKADEGISDEEGNADNSDNEGSKGKKTVDNDNNQDPDIVNLEDSNSENEPIGGRLTAGVEKRLKKRKENVTLTESQS